VRLAIRPEHPHRPRPCLRAKASSLVDTRVISCGDNAPPSPAAVSLRSALEQFQKLPGACVDLISIDPPFNSNRNCEGPGRTGIIWGETKEKRSFEDRHESSTSKSRVS